MGNYIGFDIEKKKLSHQVKLMVGKVNDKFDGTIQYGDLLKFC